MSEHPAEDGSDELEKSIEQNRLDKIKQDAAALDGELHKVISEGFQFYNGPPSMGGMSNQFNDEHVHKMLDILDKDINQSYKIIFARWWFLAGFFIIGTGLLVFCMIYLLPEHKQLFADILKFLAGGISGFGIGLSLRPKKDA